MTNINEFKERVKTLWGRDSMLLKVLLESRYHLRIYMNRIKQSRREFNASRAYTKDLVLLKDLSKSWRPNRTYMSENYFEKGFQYLSDLHKGLVLLKDLPKSLMPNRTYMSENHFWKYVSMPFGLIQKVSAIERLT